MLSPEFAVNVHAVDPAVVGAVPVIVAVWLEPTPAPEAVKLPPAAQLTAHEEIAKPENGLPALYVTGMLTVELPAVTVGLGAVIATALPVKVKVIAPCATRVTSGRGCDAGAARANVACARGAGCRTRSRAVARRVPCWRTSGR